MKRSFAATGNLLLAALAVIGVLFLAIPAVSAETERITFSVT